MASTPDRRRLAAASLAVAVTAALVFFGAGLAPWWPLLWLAPLPVLLFAPSHSRRSAATVAFLAWLLGNLNLWHYTHDVLRIPPLLLAAILGVPALVFALAVLLFRGLLRRDAPWSAILAFPAAWVSYEYLQSLVSVHGTAGSLAYSQLDNLPILQTVSVTGPWGVSFLLMLFPASLAAGLHRRRKAGGWRLLTVGTGAVVVAALLGAIRLARPGNGPVVKVGLVASDGVAVADEGAPTQALLREYAARVEGLAAKGAELIVLPEKIGVAVGPETADVDALFQPLADRTRAVIVVGLIRVAPPLKYNEARAYSPGRPVSTYTKHHMLPPFETAFEPGTTLTLLSRPSGTWGVAICKDMDFTPLCRRYGRAGVGLVAVPAWDFGLDRWAHGHMAVMRGVESGFTVARSAKEGFLTVSDARGRILAETTSDSAPFATLLADAPAGHETTPYLRLGDGFAWLVLAVLAVILVRLRKPAQHGALE